YILNDSPTDSLGHYSLEATFFSDGEPLKEFKLRFLHECFDDILLLEGNWAEGRQLRKRTRLANATAKTGIVNVVREESVPSEYIYDGKKPPTVYEFSVDLNS
ncbi:hypothetical protein AAVH_31094, partial [Aphelenchoides avenae]